MRIIIFTIFILLIVALLPAPAEADLKGSVQCDDSTASQERTPTNNPQAEIDKVIPPAPSRFNLHANDQNLITDAMTHIRVQLRVRQSPIHHGNVRSFAGYGNIQFPIINAGTPFQAFDYSNSGIPLGDSGPGLKVLGGSVRLAFDGVMPWAASGSPQLPLLDGDYHCVRCRIIYTPDPVPNLYISTQAPSHSYCGDCRCRSCSRPDGQCYCPKNCSRSGSCQCMPNH